MYDILNSVMNNCIDIVYIMKIYYEKIIFQILYLLREIEELGKGQGFSVFEFINWIYFVIYVKFINFIYFLFEQYCIVLYNCVLVL